MEYPTITGSQSHYLNRQFINTMFSAAELYRELNGPFNIDTNSINITDYGTYYNIQITLDENPILFGGIKTLFINSSRRHYDVMYLSGQATGGNHYWVHKPIQNAIGSDNYYISIRTDQCSPAWPTSGGSHVHPSGYLTYSNFEIVRSVDDNAT